MFFYRQTRSPSPETSNSDPAAANPSFGLTCVAWTRVLTFTLGIAVLLIGCSAAESPDASTREPTASSDRLFGAYVYGGVWGGEEPILAAEQLIGRDLDIAQWFMSWDNAWDEELVRAASRNGRLPLISWEPTTAVVSDIANGEWDAYIESWARGAQAYGDPIYLRPFPEMNGEWTPWNGDAETLVRAWQRMVEIFEASGADNVLWVWSPNVTDEPATESNRMELYYPGERYVDVLALDGYNWGTTRPWSTWQSFDEVFRSGYDRIAALGSQSIWFTEVASAEQGGNKGEWIHDMMGSTAFSRLDAVVWFHEDKEANWHLDSSEGSLLAIRSALQTPIASSQP